MITPLIVLAFLSVPLLIAAAIAQRSTAHGIIKLGGVVGYAAAFAFFSIGHFVITGEMVAMLPDFIPGLRIQVTGADIAALC